MVATAKDGRSFEGFAPTRAGVSVVIEISSSRPGAARSDQWKPSSQPTIVRGAKAPSTKQAAWIAMAASSDGTAMS
jgi:hypothetical protein